MSLNERTMDTVKMEAEQAFTDMMASFEKAWKGRRVEYGDQENSDEELPGEIGQQLVQRGGEAENNDAEAIAGQPVGQEISAGAGDQSALLERELRGALSGA